MWDVLHYQFKKGGNNLNENEKWPEIIEKKLWLHFYKPNRDFTDEENEYQNLDSYIYYSDIIDNYLQNIWEKIDNILSKNNLSSDKIDLIQIEFEKLSSHLIWIVEWYEQNTDEFWLVTEKYITELLKPELKKANHKIHKIIWNLHVVQ